MAKEKERHLYSNIFVWERKGKCKTGLLQQRQHCTCCFILYLQEVVQNMKRWNCVGSKAMYKISAED